MPYKDYNTNFKVDLSEDKPVLQLDLQLKPMSEAPKDGSAVLCLVRHDDTKTFDADHGGLTPYGAWLEGSARVPDGVCLLSYCGGYSETDRESGITERMPNWWFDTAERVGYPVGWYAVIDEMYPISVTNPPSTTEGETSVPYKESDTTRYTMPIQFFDFKPRINESSPNYVELDAAANQQVYALAVETQCKLGLPMPELSVDARGEYFNVRVYFLDRECNTNQTAN